MNTADAAWLPIPKGKPYSNVSGFVRPICCRSVGLAKARIVARDQTRLDLGSGEDFHWLSGYDDNCSNQVLKSLDDRFKDL